MTKPVILAYGDSNTHGTLPLTDWGARDRLAYSERWTTRLATATGTTVISEGLPGRTTVHDDPIEGAHKNGLSALPVALESHRPIDLVVLMLGTNDCKPRFSVGPADIARSVDRLLGVIAASTAGPKGTAPDVFVISPVPIREVGLLSDIFAGGAAKSQGLAKPLAEVSAAHGAWFLDAGLHAEVSPIDGVHLTDDACAAIADTLADLVSRWIATKSFRGRSEC
ncbi:MAG: SGNH/GDSL hydrolase family protein [Pseudomonadota bacterium]